MFGIIAGACGGLGSALVKKLAKENYLLLIDKDKEKLKFFKREFGDNITIESIDFEKAEEIDIDIIFENFVRKFGKIDFMINCVGACWWYPIGDMSMEIFEKMLRINLYSTFLLSKFSLKYMERQRYGTIVNISSTAALKGFRFSSAYISSKAGVIGFTRCLAEEASKYGIKVILLIPGAIQTDFVKKGMKMSHLSVRNLIVESFLDKKGIKPEDLAEFIVKLLDLPSSINYLEIIVKSS